MSEVYWQAKIWGLLHDPTFKALHDNTGRGGNSFWRNLPPMQTWVENDWNPETRGKKILEHIHLADLIASASDRAAIGSLTSSVNYGSSGLEISHLLSGEQLNFQLTAQQHEELMRDPRKFLASKEQKLRSLIPESVQADPKRLFWWLWRCLPVAACQQLNDEMLLLMPAETRLPDSSIWSHASITAALAGALAGYELTSEQIQQTWPAGQRFSHPYLAAFTFSPVQELIKSSRKMRDFWAGSWLLHYLSAKVSWQLAQQYGPDCLLYPSLYQQPLIDHWLLRTYPEFDKWVAQPRDRALLTAGFPNVLIAILPKDKVRAAMQTAKSTLLNAWRDLGQEVLGWLKSERHWMKALDAESTTWNGWLKAQWQAYWTAIPIGKEGCDFKCAAIPEERAGEFNAWTDQQNQAFDLADGQQLFKREELNFLREAYQHRYKTQGRRFSVNVGSWWPYVFDQTRSAQAAIKNARNWQMPTAFGPRSTISGLGPVVHPSTGTDWVTEGETRKFWQRHAGLFDGREELNATETLKRGLEKVLPRLLGTSKDEKAALAQVAASYPDSTAGVAGYLKVHQADNRHQENFELACQEIYAQVKWVEVVIDEMQGKWGIPYIDDPILPQRYHPRLLNSGWLVEDADTDELRQLEEKYERETDPILAQDLARQINERKVEERTKVQGIIDHYYPSNNPANWYVLAAGDGDGMSEWLKGKKLKSYGDYIPQALKPPQEVSKNFEEFCKLPKRMGPSTHNALSRALLDFSNQLVPYLTEQRYAGRLIYSGGDDVLAYTNLWEWDRWLWDIRQCFRGDRDPQGQFANPGNYWLWQDGAIPTDASGNHPLLARRPLFTMGGKATISFGIAIAHHSVPLAIALEQLWDAEAQAKDHKDRFGAAKDAVQVRVLYGNGNVLKATAKFGVFEQWQQLLAVSPNLESALFEQAAALWEQHPAPSAAAIAPWSQAFCSRREALPTDEARDRFARALTDFLQALWSGSSEQALVEEVQNWFKLAAFSLRTRHIRLGGIG